MPTEKEIKNTYLKRWDRKYGATYIVLDILQRIFYRTDAAREAFVEMCDDQDVQKLTFDSYLYKKVVMMNPWQQVKLTARTLGQSFARSSPSPLELRLRSFSGRAIGWRLPCRRSRPSHQSADLWSCA